MATSRLHRVLSIRDNQSDEKLIQKVWGRIPGIEITHVPCGAEALSYLEKHTDPLPNLILLAWRFQASHLSAIEVLIALKSDPRFRAVPVVVLAGILAPCDVHDLYMNHVSCVCEMGDSLATLERSLRKIRELWMNDLTAPFSDPSSSDGEPRLSERENEVLRLVAEDLAAKEIAARLNISVRTVEFHRDSIKRRIRVNGTAGMVRYAMKCGLLAD